MAPLVYDVEKNHAMPSANPDSRRPFLKSPLSHVQATTTRGPCDNDAWVRQDHRCMHVHARIAGLEAIVIRTERRGKMCVI